MTDLNITTFTSAIKNNIKTFYVIVGLSLIVSLFYAFTTESSYRAKIYLIPPEKRNAEILNIYRDVVGNQATPITERDIYDLFIKNSQSRKYQRRYFFDNKLHNEFTNSSKEESFEENFHERLKFTIETKLVSKEIRHQDFLTVAFEHSNPEHAAKWLNEYIIDVEKGTAEELAVSINRSLENSRSLLLASIESKRNLAKKNTLDRITNLEEALLIAQELGITARADSVNALQTVTISDENNSADQNNMTPLYLMGSDAISAEINSLKNRKSVDPFITGLRLLQERAESLRLTKINPSDIQSAQIDQLAIIPENRFKPKRKLIVILGTVFGFIIFLTYIFINSFVIRVEKSKP